jgi:hypothetical protein
VFRLNSGLGTCSEEPLDSFVSKSLDRNLPDDIAIVEPMYSRKRMYSHWQRRLLVGCLP